jgi:hypothetical protein
MITNFEQKMTNTMENIKLSKTETRKKYVAQNIIDA